MAESTAAKIAVLVPINEQQQLSLCSNHSQGCSRTELARAACL
ncbi:hypothetical protein SynROS8604_02751 [Synechococcus sp. ROS8604]|nr:hypothetical protein SynROS8604_02751 [Synechococcus sp. ROS8604]